MRDYVEQGYALECLRLAGGNIAQAERYMDFVTGKDADDAKAALEAVRAVISPSR